MARQDVSFRTFVLEDVPYVAIPDVVNALERAAEALDPDGDEAESVRMLSATFLIVALESLSARS